MKTTKRERELESENRQLRAENRRLRTENEQLQGELSRSEAKVSELAKLADELKAGLEAALARSSTAPSTPSGQKPVFLKPSKPAGTRRKKPGRKAGHPGAHRAPPATIDRVETHVLDECPHCGQPVKELHGASGAAPFRSRTVEDIVLGAMEAIEHRIRQYWCHGCSRRVEPVVAAALPSARLGINLIVTSAVQHYLYGVPVSKIATLLDQQHGMRVTPGGLMQHWHRLADFLRHQYELILGTIQAAGVLHADETGWRVRGQSWWLWCFATKTSVLYLPDRSREGRVARELLGKYFDGILVTDFYPAYNACLSRGAQFCLAHLLREFEKARNRREGSLTSEYHEFERSMVSLIRSAIKWSARSGAGPPERVGARTRFEKRVVAIIERTYLDRDVNRICNRIWRHAHGIFTFVTEPGVDPTNNWAETCIRPAVVMRKNSYGNQSARGAETQGILMSVFRSMELQGRRVIPYTLEVLEAEIRARHSAKHPQIAAVA
jgi:endogenous inhibitor of DNA gyrase (YacG/DUF329 family)